MSVALAPTAADMRAIVASLRGPHVSERSTKLGPGRVSPDRFLITCQPQVLGADPHRRFTQIARQLDCPPEAIERLTSHWERVITVHLGCDGIEPPLFKLYVEYERGKSGHADLPEDTIFLAAKWKPGEAASFSRYRELDFPRTGIEAREAVTSRYAAEAGPVSAAFAERVLRELIAPQGRVDVMLVEDENSPRRSFDINLYRIDTPLSRHRKAIETMCEGFGMPNAAAAVMADGEGTMLGHVAIGRDGGGAEFVTLYYAMEKHGHR